MKTEEEIKAIAIADAARVYRDLDLYRISIVKKPAVWELTFIFKNEEMDGGGPYYEIDPETGTILKKRYDQ
jgi:uncharacterized membrane protein YkoI